MLLASSAQKLRMLLTALEHTGRLPQHRITGMTMPIVLRMTNTSLVRGTNYVVISNICIYNVHLKQSTGSSRDITTELVSL